VEIFSDGRVLDANELSIKAKPKFNQIGSGSGAKRGRCSAVRQAKLTNVQPEVQIFARLANYGSKPASGDVELALRRWRTGIRVRPAFRRHGNRQR